MYCREVSKDKYTVYIFLLGSQHHLMTWSVSNNFMNKAVQNVTVFFFPCLMINGSSVEADLILHQFPLCILFSVTKCDQKSHLQATTQHVRFLPSHSARGKELTCKGCLMGLEG